MQDELLMEGVGEKRVVETVCLFMILYPVDLRFSLLVDYSFRLNAFSTMSFRGVSIL